MLPTTIRATWPAKPRRSTRSLFALALGALAASGCGGEARQDRTHDPIAASSSPEDCLAAVWKAQPASDRAFDRAHDRAEGGSLSCSTGTSASQFAAALTAIRTAAQSGDKAALLRQVSLPLLSIDADGRRRELGREELEGHAYSAAFPPDVVSLLGKARLDDLTVVPNQGAFLRLGAVWLAASRPGGRPRIVTVNRHALDEAKAAMRRNAR
jgi:hypothetical protein